VIVTYGLCQHHVTNARLMVKTGQLNHDATMRHLKAVYEGNILAPEGTAYRISFTDLITSKRRTVTLWPNTVGFQG
jgi:hypothetical protein